MSKNFIVLTAVEFVGLPSPAGGRGTDTGTGTDVGQVHPLSLTLMKQLAIRLSPQAGKSLVISRKREKGQTRKAMVNLARPTFDCGPLTRVYFKMRPVLLPSR
jgi:hypothetical protein